MSIVDTEKRDEDGIELSAIILVCILLLSGVPYRIPMVSGSGSYQCYCGAPTCQGDVRTCASGCSYADSFCGCGCGYTKRNCPAGDCGSTPQCQVTYCHCGCSKPTTGADRCGYGQCGERVQKGCVNYCNCDCGNNIIECGGGQCGSPETPKQGCPSFEQPCDCPCDQSVAECGRQCGGSPIPGCNIYVEKCACGCGDDVETCKGGQCGSAPKKGCINYVEYCSCNCKKPVQECPEGQCDGEPKPSCPSSEEICRCPCKIKTNLCGGQQCGQYPMAGCPSFNVDCNCGCGLDVADCGGQQCGSTPQPGCVKLELPVPEKSWHWYDYLSNYGWKNGWELKNPDGSTTKVLGLNPEWNVRSRAEHIEKGKGEALGFKMGVSPALVKDVPIVDGVKGTFLGGELDARLTTNEAGFKAMGYGAKFDLPLDFVPVIGKYFKVSGYVLAAGGKAVVDWEKGKGTFGAAALIGGSVEVSWKNMAIDAVRGWFKASIQEYVLGVDVFVWMIDTDVEEDHNVIQLVSNCHMSRRVANSKSFFLATDTAMRLLSSSEDRFQKILDVSRRTVEIDLETDLVDRYVGMQLE